MDQKTISIILLVLFLVVVLLLSVALLTNSWSIVKFTGTDVSAQNVNFGLFRGNFGTNSSKKTSDNVGSKNALYACQAFAIGGVFLILIGYALLMYSGYKMAAIAIGILALGSISSIIAAIIWGFDKNLNRRNQQGTQNVLFLGNVTNVTTTDTFGYSWYIQLIVSLISAVWVGFMAYQIFIKKNLNIANL